MILASMIAGSPSYAQIVGKESSTTIRHRDASREVITPDGRHSFYNVDGSPRGINRTCSSGPGMNVNCRNWGPNSYGGKGAVVKER